MEGVASTSVSCFYCGKGRRVSPNACSDPRFRDLSLQQIGEIINLAVVSLESKSSPGALIDRHKRLPYNDLSFSQLSEQELQDGLAHCFEALRHHLNRKDLSVYQRLKPISWFLSTVPAWTRVDSLLLDKAARYSHSPIKKLLFEELHGLIRLHRTFGTTTAILDENVALVQPPALEYTSARHGSGMRTYFCQIDPKTGKISALSTQPPFKPDPNHYIGQLRVFRGPRDRPCIKWKSIQRVSRTTPRLTDRAKSVVKLTRLRLSLNLAIEWFNRFDFDQLNGDLAARLQKNRRYILLRWQGCAPSPHDASRPSQANSKDAEKEPLSGQTIRI